MKVATRAYSASAGGALVGAVPSAIAGASGVRAIGTRDDPPSVGLSGEVSAGDFDVPAAPLPLREPDRFDAVCRGAVRRDPAALAPPFASVAAGSESTRSGGCSASGLAGSISPGMSIAGSAWSSISWYVTVCSDLAGSTAVGWAAAWSAVSWSTVAWSAA